MTIEIDLPEDAVRRLKAEADRQRLSVDGLIAKMASELPVVPTGAGRRPAFLAIGASESGTTDQIGKTLAEGFGLD